MAMDIDRFTAKDKDRDTAWVAPAPIVTTGGKQTKTNNFDRGRHSEVDGLASAYGIR